MRQPTVAALLVAALTWSGSATAAEICAPADELSTCVPADNLWPQAGSHWLSQGPIDIAQPNRPLFGFSNSYLLRPIGLRIASPDPQGTTVYAVEHALSATFMFAYGLSSRLHMDIAVPATLFQVGASKADVIGSDDKLPLGALGDLRFGSHFVFLPRSGPCGWALAGRMVVAAPTGDKVAFAAAPSVTFAPGVSAEYHRKEWRLGFDVGARLRRFTQIAGAILGNQLTASVATSYDVLPDRWLTLHLEAFGFFTLLQQTEQVVQPGELIANEEASSQPHLPAEWLLTASTGRMLQGRVRARIGAGTMIPTGGSSVTTPLFRAVAAIEYRHASTPSRASQR